MAPSLLETLPLPQRLALAYAPARARDATLALFALDARLGQALRVASEPIMAQMRLAWWRDQFGLAQEERERSDELVRALDPLAAESDALTSLVDGWELLLSEDFSEETAIAFASSRAQSFLGLARALDSAQEADAILLAGQRWALADLAAGLGNPDEREIVLSLSPREKPATLPRAMRPLAILDGLAHRSLAKGGAGMLEGPLSALAAMRLGLLGR